jgi:hypothetical protein
MVTFSWDGSLTWFEEEEPQPGHADGLIVSGQCGWLPVEGVDLGGDGGVFAGDWSAARVVAGKQRAAGRRQ